MAKRTKRQRLKRDPCNQPLDKLVAWARRDGRVLQIDTGKGLVKLMPRIIWVKEWERYMRLRYGRYWNRHQLFNP